MLRNNKPDITMQFLMLSVMAIEVASVPKISTSPLLVGSLGRPRIRLLPGRIIFSPWPLTGLFSLGFWG